VHFTDLVVHAGVEEDALGRGRFAGVDVRRDTDVPVGSIGVLRDMMSLQMQEPLAG